MAKQLGSGDRKDVDPVPVSTTSIVSRWIWGKLWSFQIFDVVGVIWMDLKMGEVDWIGKTYIC